MEFIRVSKKYNTVWRRLVACACSTQTFKNGNDDHAPEMQWMLRCLVSSSRHRGSRWRRYILAVRQRRRTNDIHDYVQDFACAQKRCAAALQAGRRTASAGGQDDRTPPQ